MFILLRPPAVELLKHASDYLQGLIPKEIEYIKEENRPGRINPPSTIMKEHPIDPVDINRLLSS